MFKFKIKNLEIQDNNITITDQNKKKYGVNLYDSKLTKLLILANKRSKSIGKNIKYVKNCHRVSKLCLILSLVGAFTPLLLGRSYAEVFLIGFGGLSFASASTAVFSKLYEKWLKKYAVSNEYWEEIYDLVSNKQYNYQSTYSNEKTNTHDNSKRNTNSNSYSTNFENKSDCTYSYRKNDIIQDYPEKQKTKTYKRY